MKYIVLYFLSITTLWAQDTTTTKRYHYKVWIKPSLSINYLAVDIEDSPININLKNKTINKMKTNEQISLSKNV